MDEADWEVHQSNRSLFAVASVIGRFRLNVWGKEGLQNSKEKDSAVSSVMKGNVPIAGEP